MKKLKQKIATILLLSAVTVGSISINVNIDSKKFWARAEKGELYVTSFNMKQYKLLRPELIKQMRKEKIAPQMKQLWVQTLDREIKKSEKGTWHFEAKEGETINVNSPEFINMLNDRLEQQIKE